MPLKSKAQMRWMFVNDPAMAREWMRGTPNPEQLPERAAVKSAMKERMRENKPNSGKRPPNLTTTTGSRNCASCVHWEGPETCKLYDYKTAPDQTCDAWGPKPN